MKTQGEEDAYRLVRLVQMRNLAPGYKTVVARNRQKAKIDRKETGFINFRLESQVN